MSHWSPCCLIATAPSGLMKTEEGAIGWVGISWKQPWVCGASHTPKRKTHLTIVRASNLGWFKATYSSFLIFSSPLKWGILIFITGYSNKYLNDNFYDNFACFYDNSMWFPPCFLHWAPLSYKFILHYRPQSCFSRASVIKNIILLKGLGKKKEIKHEGKKKKERNEKGKWGKMKWERGKMNQSADPVTSRHWHPHCLHCSRKEQELRVEATGYMQKWWASGRCGPSPSKDSHTPCIET